MHKHNKVAKLIFIATDAVEVVSDEVLAIASLDPTELANQASRLLEEHDITSMLNQIPADAFNDIFLGILFWFLVTILNHLYKRLA